MSTGDGSSWNGEEGERIPANVPEPLDDVRQERRWNNFKAGVHRLLPRAEPEYRQRRTLRDADHEGLGTSAGAVNELVQKKWSVNDVRLILRQAMDAASVGPELPRRHRNPRFQKSERPASARSSVPRHDPTYSNRKMVYPRGGELWEEPEYFVKEKYDLLLDIDELRKECRELKRELNAAKEQNYEAQQVEESLREFLGDNEDGYGRSDRTVLLSTRMEDLRVELKGLDDQLKLYEEMFTTENQKELDMFILQQRSEMVALQGQNKRVERQYLEALKHTRNPKLSQAKNVYEEQISVMDLLTRKLDKEHQKYKQLSQEKAILEAPVPLHGDLKAELEKLKKKHRNLLHTKNTRKADCKALDTKHQMEIDMLRDLKQEEAKQRIAARERRSFQRKAGQRRNTYRSRAPGNIAGDKIRYRKSKEKSKRQSTESEREETVVSAEFASESTPAEEEEIVFGNTISSSSSSSQSGEVQPDHVSSDVETD